MLCLQYVNYSNSLFLRYGLLLFGAKIRIFLIIALQIHKTNRPINTISSIKEEFQVFQVNFFYKRNIFYFCRKFLL